MSSNTHKTLKTKITSSPNSYSSQQNNVSGTKWNQCTSCGLIISKQLNDEHTCQVNKIINEQYLNELIEKEQTFLCTNVCYLRCIEHSKGKKMFKKFLMVAKFFQIFIRRSVRKNRLILMFFF